MTNVTSVESVKSSLGTAAGQVDATSLQTAYDAAEAYVADRCRWAVPGSTAPAPSALVQAVNLLTARFLARRNSPTGVLGVGDFGEVRLGGGDRDVDRLIAPYRKVVLG